MTTGTSLDIVSRIKKEIPKGWFNWVAPYRDAVIGSLADSAAWNYTLVQYAKAQTRLSSAYGIWLDIFSYDFLGRYLPRAGLSDSVFRSLIKATILQERVTRAGMVNAITTLTGVVPTVFEPWNTYDTGAYSPSLASGRQQYGSMGYGVGRGGYGSMALPAQAFLKVNRGAFAGVPGVGGYGSDISGYGTGRVEYTGSSLSQVGITLDMVYQVINITKPTGTTMWVAVNPPAPQRRAQCIFAGPDAKANSQYIAII